MDEEMQKLTDKNKISKKKRISIILLIIIILLSLLTLILVLVFNIDGEEEEENINIEVKKTENEKDDIIEEYKLDSEFIDFNPKKIHIKLEEFSNPNTIKRFPFDEKTDTKCLDGSQYGIYYGPGRGSGSNKVVIGFEGGGWCLDRNVTNMANKCSERFGTYYGTSKVWKDEYNYEDNFFAGDIEKNKQFYNWHRFLIPYCDGTGNQGHIEYPIKETEKGKDLYFRGYKNTVEAFKFIFTHVDLDTLDKVVLSGCSSGGWSVLNWMSTIENFLEKVNTKTVLLGIMNGGFFLGYDNLITEDNDFLLKFKNMYSFANNESPAVNRRCLKDYQNLPYSCLFPEILIDYVKSPVLMYQFQYDSWQIWETLGEKCVSDSKSLINCDFEKRPKIIEMRNFSNVKISNAYNKKKNLSVFSPACVNHCFSDDQRTSEDFKVNNLTIDDVMTIFIEEKGKNQIILIDNFEWPGNEGCAYDKIPGKE